MKREFQITVYCSNKDYVDIYWLNIHVAVEHFIFVNIRSQAGTVKINNVKISCPRIIIIRENGVAVFGVIWLSLAS